LKSTDPLGDPRIASAFAGALAELHDVALDLGVASQRRRRPRARPVLKEASAQ